MVAKLLEACDGTQYSSRLAIVEQPLLNRGLYKMAVQVALQIREPTYDNFNHLHMHGKH
jgi:hypothetical protein